MNEYIERKAIRDALYDADAITMSGVKILNQFPVADVAPVRHGRWIEHEDGVFTCSECGNAESNESYFCRYCGAKMDG